VNSQTVKTTDFKSHGNQVSMQIKKLSNEELLAAIKTQYQTEIRSTADMILYIQEVDRRRLYLSLGHTSLFSFLTKDLGYTPASAQRRIDAARLMTSAPEIKKDLEDGSLNLMQVAMVAQSVRRKRKENPQTQIKTAEILENIKNEDLQTTQKILGQKFNLEVKTFEKTRVQQDDSVRLEMTLSPEEMEVLQCLRELKSHSHPGASLKDLFLALAREELKRKTPITSKMETAPSRAAVRRIVFQRDKCCQWRDPKTNQLCGSRFQLQIDHIKSRWRGGGNEIENLQLLCSAHNRLKYRLEVRT
jgi:hypothetical protein